METTTDTPALRSWSTFDDETGMQIAAEIVSLDDEGSYITLTDKDGVALKVPHRFLDTLKAYSVNSLRADIDISVGELRKNFLLNQEFSNLSELPEGKVDRFVLKTYNVNTLGLPMIRWQHSYKPLKSTWELSVVGANQDTILASVAWDDVEGFRNLLNLMGNNAEVFGMFALVYPDDANRVCQQILGTN